MADKKLTSVSQVGLQDATYIFAETTDGIHKVSSDEFGGFSGIELTQAEYDALSDNETNADVVYFVTDANDDKEIVYVGSNPNLLINGDFRNPINQRGATSYTGSGSNIYTIDRWRISVGIATVNDGSVTYTNNTTSNGGFTQVLEHPMDISDGFTVSVKVKSITGSAKIRARIGETNYEKDLEVGVNTYSNKSDSVKLNYVMILLSPNSSIELEWCKLEQGSVATPFVPRIYGEEFALCQRYFQVYGMMPIYAQVSSPTYYMGFTFVEPMRTTPTMNLTQIRNSAATVVSGITLLVANLGSRNVINFQVSETVGQYGYINCNFDAEIY